MSRSISHFSLLSCFLFFFLMCSLVFSELPSSQNSTMMAVSQQLNNARWDATKEPNPCLWQGVLCSRPDNNSVISVSLSGFGLSSSDFLSTLCKIESLQSLNLSNNYLGSIPDWFFSGCGASDGLRSLDFSNNKLVGILPTFRKFAGLEFLDLSTNSMSGGIDLQFDGLASLKNLSLSTNIFSGPVPSKFGKSKVLEQLDLSRNRFQGKIPVEIMEYRNLTMIDFSANNLTGSIPDAIGNLSKLEVLILSANNLGGIVPATLSNITTLTRFAANQNNFVGNISSGITNHLKVLDLSYNQLDGLIPFDLLSQANLETLDLSYNRLKGSIPESISPSLVRLRLGNNLLSGPIPPASFTSLQNLTYLELESNSFTGSIPAELGLCKKLALLNLAHNRLNGTLPVLLANLSKLQVLRLQLNNLVGKIPAEIGNLSLLTVLNVSWNSLTGGIPPSVSRLQKLLTMHLQGNSLSGSIPEYIGNMSSLLELQLGENKLSGNIPVMPVKLQIALNLSTNLFDGVIPSTLYGLDSLEILDLSNNKFSGEIPSELTRLSSLTQLVLYNNQLSGIIPRFAKHVSLNVSGNPKLINATGENSGPYATGKKKRSVVLAVVIAFASGFLVVVVAAVIILSISRRFYRISDVQLRPPADSSLPQILQGNLLTANGIHRSNIDFAKGIEAVANPANIVLKTRFSSYYKAIMPSGACYFIKKLNWSDKIFQLGNHDKFEQELKVLGRLSDSNVMIPLAYVLTVDSAYLFYDYAPKGILFDVLHGSSETSLDWASRYSIAVGVAQGLAFLHGCTSGPILLLDLSSRNILLKSLKEPKVGDIELCKVIDPSKSTGSLSTIAGSVGYIPPEYAYTMRITMAGNVYSFGVVLLELLTGKPAVSEGVELAKWVLRNSGQRLNWDHILDFRISRTSLAVRNQMLSVLKVALTCVSVSSDARPKMKSVWRMLVNAR